MQVTPLPDAASFLTAAAPVLMRDPAVEQPAPGYRAAARRPARLLRPGPLLGGRGGRRGRRSGAADPARIPRSSPTPCTTEAVDALVAALAAAQPALPGVTANEPWARRFAEGWTATTGVGWRLGLGQGVYALTRVRAPTTRAGRGEGRDRRRSSAARAMAACLRGRGAAGHASRRRRHGSRHRGTDRPGRDGGIHLLAGRRPRRLADRLDAHLRWCTDRARVHPAPGAWPRLRVEPRCRRERWRGSSAAPRRATCTPTSGIRRRTRSTVASATGRSPSPR